MWQALRSRDGTGTGFVNPPDEVNLELEETPEDGHVLHDTVEELPMDFRIKVTVEPPSDAEI